MPSGTAARMPAVSSCPGLKVKRQLSRYAGTKSASESSVGNPPATMGQKPGATLMSVSELPLKPSASAWPIEEPSAPMRGLGAVLVIAVLPPPFTFEPRIR